METIAASEYRKSRRSYLISKIDNLPATLTLGKEEYRSHLLGEIVFICFLNEKRDPQILIESFNLLSPSMKSPKGETGMLSLTLAGEGPVRAKYDHKSGRLAAEFKMKLHYPLLDRELRWKYAEDHYFVPHTEIYRANIEGEFEQPLTPRPYEHELLHLHLDLHADQKEQFLQGLQLSADLFLPAQWIRIGVLRLMRYLPIRPVFIGRPSALPYLNRPTGASFYPLIDRANEIWRKCCIQFNVLCPPRYVEDADYRVLTTGETSALRNEIDEENAIEVFVVSTWDPEDQYGGGATWSSGTADSKVITADNQLPLNENHLAHELGHVLGLGHPGADDDLVDGCVGSIMEPSGFYADNPSEQCWSNCRNASNPLLCYHPHQPWCITGFFEDEDDLF
jgi:hypothetical protein